MVQPPCLLRHRLWEYTSIKPPNLLAVLFLFFGVPVNAKTSIQGKLCIFIKRTVLAAIVLHQINTKILGEVNPSFD
jgi:hypothetical protein